MTTEAPGGLTAAVSCCVAPTPIDALDGDTVIDLTFAAPLPARTVSPSVDIDLGDVGGSAQVAIVISAAPSASETANGLKRMLILLAGSRSCS